MTLDGRVTNLTAGTVLLADLSGFTGMTEVLLRHGREGAGILSGILDHMFTRAVRTIHGFGGAVAQFEGDGLLAVFPESLPWSAYHAASSLLTYFQTNGLQRTGLGAWQITAGLALTSGEIEWGIAGDSRLVHLVRGQAIYDAYDLSSICEPGKLTIHDSFLKSTGAAAGIDPDKAPEPEAIDLPAPRKILRTTALRFADGQIISSGLTGEFRRVIPVFLSFRNISGRTGLLNTLTDLLDLAADFGGNLQGVYARGVSNAEVLVLFGAPQSRENDVHRACDFVLALGEKMGDTLRVGMSSGTVYAGMTGSSGRCTYTVFGDTVNTAARLQHNASWGEVLTSGLDPSEMDGSFTLDQKHRCELRGRKQKVVVSRLSGRTGSDSIPSRNRRLVGRAPEMSYLLSRTGSARVDSLSGLTVLCGNAGIGKSRLLDEVGDRIDEGTRILMMKCDDILRRSLNPFIYLLGELFNDDKHAMSQSQTDLTRLEDGLARIGGQLRDLDTPASLTAREELEMAGPILASLLDKPVSQIESGGDRFENIAMAVGSLLKAFCLISPVILMLDDIQWMDDDSRRLFRVLGRTLRTLPLAVLAAGRPLDDDRRPTTGLEANLDTRALDLGGLRGFEARELVIDRLGSVPGSRLMDFIDERTSGNPLYIEQFCLYLLGSDFLEHREGTIELVPGRIEIPSGIRSILVARMDRLTPELRRLLQTASVIGSEFDVDVLSEVHRRPDISCELLEGERERLWSMTSGRKCAFGHSLYRDAAYGMLLDRRRRKLHERTARVLEKLAGDDTGAAAGSIAHHYQGAASIDNAVSWGWEALEYAIKGNRNHESLYWAERLSDWLRTDIPSGARNPLLADVLLKKNLVLDCLGDRAAQRENLVLLEELCTVENWPAKNGKVCQAYGTLHYLTGDMDAAEQYYRTGLESARSSGDRKTVGNILGNLGILRKLQGRTAQATGFYLQALQIHREEENLRAEGNVLGNLGILRRLEGELDSAEESYRKALEIHRLIGNRAGEGSILCGLGNLMKDRERIEEAKELYTEALDITRTIGDRRYEAVVLSNLGNLEGLRENFTESLEYFSSALEIHKRIGNLIGEADTLLMTGNLYLMANRLDEAIDHLHASLHTARKIRSGRRECNALSSLGNVYIANGSLDEAVSCYLEVKDLIDKMGLPAAIVINMVALRDDLIEKGVKPEQLPLPDSWPGTADEDKGDHDKEHAAT